MRNSLSLVAANAGAASEIGTPMPGMETAGRVQLDTFAASPFSMLIDLSGCCGSSKARVSTWMG